MGIGVVKSSKHSERAVNEGGEGQACGIGDSFQPSKRPEMYNRVWVIAQGHQDADNSLKMQAGRHTADLGMDTTQSSSTASTSVGFPDLNNGVHEPVDCSVGKGVSRIVA